MTDEQIIKALESCCMSDIPPCATCKYDVDTITCDECMGELMKDALELINRQKAENEKLREKTKIIFPARGNGKSLRTAIMIKDLMNGAVRDFAELIKSRYPNKYLVSGGGVYSTTFDRFVDDLVKEMECK